MYVVGSGIKTGRHSMYRKKSSNQVVIQGESTLGEEKKRELALVGDEFVSIDDLNDLVLAKKTKPNYVLADETEKFMLGARVILTGQASICFISQCFCCAVLFMTILRDSRHSLEFYPRTNVVLLRFICSIGLHSALHEDLKNGLQNMKFVINHEERF